MRYLRLIAILLAVCSALLVFPNRIPEFAGLWLLWCAIRFLQGKKVRFELLAIPVWFAIKWPEPIIALAVFVVIVIVVSLWQPDKIRNRWIAVGLLASAWLASVARTTSRRWDGR